MAGAPKDGAMHPRQNLAGSAVIEKTRQLASPHSQPSEHWVATLAPCLKLLPCQRRIEADEALEKCDVFEYRHVDAEAAFG